MNALLRFAGDRSLWQVLGSHVEPHCVRFAVWAPHARQVAVIGDFNDWDAHSNIMERSSDGIWTTRIEDIGDETLYQYEITTAHGERLLKSDPFAQFAQLQPQRSSLTYTSHYTWRDAEWMQTRAGRQPHAEPMSIYEVHLGSWRRGLTYADLATELVDYVVDLGFTHVEFLPVAEHPFIGSWGYQTTGYFAPTSRFGAPDDLRALIDAFHNAGIGVILDWVPAHFPKDDWGLGRFDGQSLFEPPEFDEHPDWGTHTFDFAKPEVRSFLLSNALYWLGEFHVDGLRVDAVASMLYLDYSREHGQWKPNAHGGRENLEAVAFLQELNSTCYGSFPGIAMIAEDSTSWPGATVPVHLGGLGFGFTWNLGWMHDTLGYVREDPIHRQFHHGEMTLPASYAFGNNYILPLSHDEVVHGKGSLLRKAPGHRRAQLATLRAYLAYMWAHPGKKLLFMGGEFGQDREWSERRSLDWDLREEPGHETLRAMVCSLGRAYADTPALWAADNEPDAFGWIAEDDQQHNVVSFARSVGPQTVVCVSNFAGVAHDNYVLGLPHEGVWSIIVDSSSTLDYDKGSSKPVFAEPVAHGGHPASAALYLPALTTMWLSNG